MSYKPLNYNNMTDQEIEELSEKRYQNCCKLRGKKIRRWAGVKDTGKFKNVRG